MLVGLLLLVSLSALADSAANPAAQGNVTYCRCETYVTDTEVCTLKSVKLALVKYVSDLGILSVADVDFFEKDLWNPLNQNYCASNARIAELTGGPEACAGLFSRNRPLCCPTGTCTVLY